MNTDFLSNLNTALFTTMGIAPKEINGCKIFDSGGQHPLFNGAMHVEIGHPEFDSMMNRVQAYFHMRKLPYSVWIAAAEALPSIKELLEKKGMHLLGECPGMVLDINKFVVPKDVPELDIVSVESSEVHKKWVAMIARAFEFSADATMSYEKLTASAGFHGPFYHLSGLRDGKVICTGSLLCTAKGAYIFNISTAAEERHKGYASALSYALIQLAKDKGMTRIGLASSSEAVQLYSQLGFEKVFSYNVYVG